MRIAFFVTCLTDSFYPRAGIAAVKVLEKLGCEVAFPTAQTCCGQPMFNNGYREGARELAKHFVRVFEPYEVVVTPSASCASTIKHHYHELLGDDPAYGHAVHQLAGKTYEFSQFLTQQLKVDLREHQPKWPGVVTYHYSCHSRGLGMVSPELAQLTVGGQKVCAGEQSVLRLLAQVQGLTVKLAERSDQCCGFGGTFAMKLPEVSGAMVRDKVQCLAGSGAQVVVSNEPGCTMNIAGMSRRMNVPLQYMSLSELLAEAMGLLPRSHVNQVLASSTEATT